MGGDLPQKTSPLDEKFKRFVEERLTKWNVPGVAVSIVDKENTWAEGYGFATLPGTPVTPSTLFYAGSTTKAHVAAALGMMIESGQYTTDADQPLSWSSPISSLIRDDFVLEDAWATQHVTLEDALCHRTGMPRHDEALARSYNGRAATVRDATRILRHLPLTYEPRVKWQYCNHMYTTLSHVIETLAGGRWLGDLLCEWLWRPLGMCATVFSLEDALSSQQQHLHLATGYYWNEAKQAFGQITPMSGGEISGSGAVISNVEDYARWMRFWMEDADAEERTGLSVSMRTEIMTPRIFEVTTAAPHDTPMAYALGWRTGSYRGHRWWFHSGGMDGFGAEVWIFPGLKFGVTTLANTADTSNALGEELVWHLVDNKLRVPESERWGWSSKWERKFSKSVHDVENAVDILYPDRVDPPIPRSLPLEQYAGVYFHPGYRYMTLELAKSGEISDRPDVELVADRRDFTLRTFAEFRHVSGESWVMYLSPADANVLFMQSFAAVQFKVGLDGRVQAMGVEWRSGQAVQGLIWYHKLE